MSLEKFLVNGVSTRDCKTACFIFILRFSFHLFDVLKVKVIYSKLLSRINQTVAHSSQSCFLNFQDPNTKVKEFMESKPLLSDFDAQIKYYQRLETQIEELPGSYHIGPVEYLTDRIKEALVTETKAWKQAFGKALAQKVNIYN